MSNKERQASFRAKKAEQGYQEVRGIYAHKQDHKAIKDYADRIAKARNAEVRVCANAERKTDGRT